MESKIINPIAYIKTDFKEKFGIPRQSGRSPSSVGEIVFRKEFSDENAFRGIEEFSHLWIVFDFNAVTKTEFSPMIRPPRLGGNKKVGVFASRSPFRPNGLGLSSVKLEKVTKNTDGTISIAVSGVDLLDGTPVYDIKPYIPSCDCHVDAKGGFSEQFTNYQLNVVIPDQLLSLIPIEKRKALIECLKDDPRPSYQDDDREYGMAFSRFNVKFKVEKDTLTVIAIDNL
ncbi:MAG: tRNA (N6-threonylcarbamoyladenosine(37)-N6)-methyltransferase TrmO [Clostridia bacterium]|nr:tRNA (N6-threonylcarbamoyladenosine(37)-N6)-methyltransferase TrmO [Clostridia bacterium]